MSKPTVIHSEKLTELLENKIKQGLLKQARAKAFWCSMLEGSSSSWTGGMDAIAQVLDLINDKHGLPCSFTSAAVQKSAKRWWVFVFDLSELEAIEFARTQIVRGKVSPKVLARMVADRIDKTHHWAGDYVDVTRELFTPEAFDRACGIIHRKYHSYSRNTPHQLHEVEFLLKREDITQETIDEGWALWRVRGVMDA